jgi:hypothetical protein
MLSYQASLICQLTCFPFSNLFRHQTYQRANQQKVEAVHANWAPLLDDMADAYLAWKNGGACKSSPFGVLSLYSMSL